MNAAFVSVKVDREERPDVDAVYMDAVQAINGHGGWPMTVFLTPDGRPFFGGTYFPKPAFLQLLAAVDEAWHDRRGELLDQAGQLTEALDRTARLEPAETVPGVEHLNAGPRPSRRAVRRRMGRLRRRAEVPAVDEPGAPAAGPPYDGSADALAVVTTSLDAMASGGIYDHLGGGFARYSVDRQWLVPHFEKMLYDQALLIPVYLHAWQVTGEARYRQVVDETVAYVRRDLGQADGRLLLGRGRRLARPRRPQRGGPVLHLDAGRDRRRARRRRPHGGRARLVRRHRGGQLRGPHDPAPRPSAATCCGRRPWRRRARRLFEAREQPAPPGLDDKVLTEWNALMVAALAEAGAATGTADWLDAARQTAEFLLAELRDDDGRWRRSWQRDVRRPPRRPRRRPRRPRARLRRAGRRPPARPAGSTEAQLTADVLLDRFWDAERGGLFTTADDGEALIVRQKDLLDSATPSANSLAAVALYRLGGAHRRGPLRPPGRPDPAARRRRRGRVRRRRSPTCSPPSTCGGRGVTEIAVAGDRPDLVAAVHGRYLPDAVLAWGERYDSPLWAGRRDGLAYVCRDYALRGAGRLGRGLGALLG